ncbi:glycerol-3-phosphate acyltransferase 1, mitochondrial isoform X2 [Bradysia coprophila]|nr:glycerol-3-phosphate acyltransferase 1, mitochondrial isoform X2 [Bradysia coprophila]XP_037027226.1 glycerol-3-phosphate acyltransferase 1, mitochondrial isoform X2 [Bradysia coprophila]XP_037027227.1 glycerol-3-phosphate acyltransferase 1, mitochondrial isoform X2 [Bradysia coprophila]XP_037027228.1 glycerol-3-phosphate acyltransferase 1, mitochondrial isoform X2 [Bradysia coprophila]XP_037027232.1 glycerol-3-phosphate acyltransferase 1, mitochondrial isoform X2 [Bradysia coprophila]
MVDVISARVQDAFGTWRLPTNVQNGGENTRPEERISTNQLRRVGDEHRRRKAYIKDLEKKAIEKNLYEIKEATAPTVSLPEQQNHGLACRHCAPSTSEVQLDPVERRRDVKNILTITQHAGWRPDSTIFDWGGWFPFLAQCIRLKKSPYPQVSGTVLGSERLRNAIEQAAQEAVTEKRQTLQKDDDDEVTFDENSYYVEMLRKHEKRAKRLIWDMRSKLSDVMLRITSWVLYKLLPCFLSGVVAHPAQVEMLKAAAAKSPKAPLIFLPLHRSHLDYILVSFILLNNDIRSPIVAAGENLRIPFFGSLLRGLGAFFIKRKIDPVVGKKDVVYRAVLHTYMQEALKVGHNVEFFIEGGRTRTGKPCMPKNGVLSVIVDAFMDETIPDALLVPVSVNYERLVDGNFVYEQLGQRKKPESFRSAISAIWHILHSRYGLMRIDFNEPFSLRELVKSFNRLSPDPFRSSDSLTRRLQHNPSSSSLYGTDIVREEQRSLVDNISRHVVYDCASATAVMTTNAVAFLLLTRFRDGATLSVLAEALDDLRGRLNGVKDIGFTGDSKDICQYAADLLGPNMITVEKRSSQLFFKPVTMIPNVIELSYYSNSLVPHFALESIMITALNALAKEFERRYPSREFSVGKDDLFKACLDHCDILRFEFILNKPCQQIDKLLNETLDRLRDRDLIQIPQVMYTEEQKWSRRFAMELESDDSDDDRHYQPTNDEMVHLTSNGHCERLVLMSVLAPYGHTYLAVAVCLRSLLGTSMVESEFIKNCVSEITSKVENLECKFGESVSTDSIRNCIKVFEKWSVIEISSCTGVRMISLGPMFDNNSGIDNTIQRIQKVVPF